MSSRKPSSIATKIVATFAIAALSLSAFAGRYWVAADNSDALWSNTANWSDQKDGTSGATEPGDGTGTIYFCKYKNGATIFDKLGVGPGNVLFGTQDSRYFVWSATDPTYGLDATGKELQICQNISNSDRTPAKLQIDSGTYKFGKVFVSYIAKGTAELLLKGGTVATTASGADILGVCMIASGLETTTGKLTIDGGALDCTSGDFFSVGGRSNTTATVHLKSGSLTAKGFLLGGRGGHKSLREVDNAVATMILDGGTLTTSGECAIGDSYGSGTSSEMIINPGATYNCNYGYFYVGEAGPGTLTMNGGTFTMIGSSDGKGGLSLGRSKNEKDVATLALNGGTLTTERFRLDYVQPGSKITFNGTTIKPTRTITSFLNTSDRLTCEVAERGLVFDTAGFDVTIAHPLVAADGAATTPLVKKGAGTLKIDGTTPFDASDITVYAGSVVIGDVTYGVNAEAAIDASAGGDLGEVVIHREKLEDWLKDADFRNVAKHGAYGTAMMEQPEPVVIDVNGNRKTYINLETGKTYNDTIDNVSFSFTTEDLAPRTLQIIAPDNDPVENVRDVGSWPLLGGGKMNQGVILRGGHLDHFVNATAEQREASYLTTFGIKTEIELRKDGVDLPAGYKTSNNEIVTDSFAADNCAYVYCGLGWGDDAGTQIRADDNGNFTNQIHKVFSTWGTPGNLPSYFHCRIGTDRTGIVGLLLLGFMGVEEEVLYRDYLMSNFANIESSRSTDVPDTFIRYLLRGNCGNYTYTSKDAEYGTSIASRARQYLEMCGVTEQELDVIATALSGETADEVLARVNAYEQANNVRTVSYVPYSGSTDVKGMHRLPAGEHLLPLGDPTRDGYIFRGWDTENEANGIVYALWESETDLPKSLTWDNAAGDNDAGSAANWMVKDSDPAQHCKPRIIDEVEVTASNSHPVLTADETFAAANIRIGRNSDNYPTFDIEGGTFTVDNHLNLGRWGESGEMNVHSGAVTVAAVAVGNWGSHVHNKLNIYGGTFTASKRSEWPQDAITLGLQEESRGDMNVYGGEVVANGPVNVGFANYVGHVVENASVLTIDGGAMTVNSTVKVAQEYHDASGCVVVKNGTLAVTGDLDIANTSNSWAEVEVSGGTLTVGGTMRVGNHAYAQHAVLEVSGGTLDAATVSVARECSALLEVSGGGTVVANIIEKAQGAPAAASPTAFFDGGTIVFKQDYDYNFGSFDRITIGEGGLTVDTQEFSPKFQAYTEIVGPGGFTKKGSGTLTLVANSFGRAGTYAARGEIVVEEGTLVLPANQTIYCAGTQVAEGATLDLNGSTIVVVSSRVVSAVWTDASGDHDARNPLNWTCTVVYFDANGKPVPSISETISGVLTTSDTVLRISKDVVQPEHMDEITYKSVSVVAATDVSLIVDFDSTYDEYAASGNIVVTGERIKVLNSFNALLDSAVAWYDPSEVSTLKLNADGTVNGLVNKGRLGSALDFEPMGSVSESQAMPIIERADGWMLDGISFAATNRGFKTARVSALAGDKTLICVDRHVDGEWYPFLANGNDVYEWVGACELWGSLFRYYVNGGEDWGAVLNMNGAPGTDNKNTIRSIRVASKAVKGELYYAADGNIYTGSADGIDNLISEDMRLCMGERSWWNGSAKNGYVGESFAFDTALSDAAMTAVRQYLASRWLGGEFTLITNATTFGSLTLEGTTVDFDGAPVVLGVLGGSGEISNATSLSVTGFAFDLADGGEMPRIVANCPVNASDATVVLSEELMAAVHPGDSIVVFEAPGNIAFGGSRHISSQLTSRRYVVRPHINSETTTLVLTRDGGFALSIR